MTSFVPPLGNDKSKVLTLNLFNRMIFRAADEATAVQAGDFLGKKRVVKRSWGFSAGERNVNYSETEEHRIKTHKLRNLREHECVLEDCERGFRRVKLKPLGPDGTVARWYARWPWAELDTTFLQLAKKPTDTYPRTSRTGCGYLFTWLRERPRVLLCVRSKRGWRLTNAGVSLRQAV